MYISFGFYHILAAISNTYWNIFDDSTLYSHNSLKQISKNGGSFEKSIDTYTNFLSEYFII